MRSLVVKLTLAFLIVGLVGAALVAVLVRQTTRSAFDQFILDQEQAALVATLEQYYQANGTWEGIASSLRRQPDNGPPQQDGGGGGGGGPGFNRGLSLFTLVGLDGRVIFGGPPSEVGQRYSGEDLSKAEQIQVSGETVGWLVRRPVPDDLVRNSPEGMFLRRVNRAALISALVAAALALLLGGLLAFTLTRSLRELKDAADEIARGRLGRQVNIRSKDELGELAASFNQMSADLARATQARQQMTADIAHDLRTPLSVIAGYTEALSDGKLSGSAEIYAVLHQETQYLRRLIDDLRVLSLADAGELPLNLQQVQPHPFLEQAALRHSVAAARAGIALRTEPSPELPSVQGDPERLYQVFDNLIGNAIRHTPEGGEIVLSARQAEGAATPDGRVQLQVRDTGRGIAPEDLPNIFERFYRGDKSRSQAGESGLGLAIARSIVEAHKGSITVTSEPGRGSTFIVSLPILPQS